MSKTTENTALYTAARPMRDMRINANHQIMPDWLAEPVEPPEVSGPAPSDAPLPSAHEVWQHGINRLVRDVDFPPEVITALRTAEPRWADDEPADAAPTLSHADDELDTWPDPCASCGSLELWQNVLGDWKCSKCEPPTLSRRLARVAQRIKQLNPGGLDASPVHKPAPGTICPCGSTTWRDVPIHDGNAIRRDCGRCGRFLDFPVWDGSEFPLH
jgi:hypothetical protein